MQSTQRMPEDERPLYARGVMCTTLPLDAQGGIKGGLDLAFHLALRCPAPLDSGFRRNDRSCAQHPFTHQPPNNPLIPPLRKAKGTRAKRPSFRRKPESRGARPPLRWRAFAILAGDRPRRFIVGATLVVALGEVHEALGHHGGAGQPQGSPLRKPRNHTPNHPHRLPP